MSSVVSQALVKTDPATGRFKRAGGKPVIKLDAAVDGAARRHFDARLRLTAHLQF